MRALHLRFLSATIWPGHRVMTDLLFVSKQRFRRARRRPFGMCPPERRGLAPSRFFSRHTWSGEELAQELAQELGLVKKK
jgi:hypothetical protein